MIVALLLFGLLNFSDFTPKIDVANIAQSASTTGEMEIASDAGFSNKTLKFNGGQTIYVRISTENEGQDKHDLNLRNSQYNLLNTYPMVWVGGQFTVNFAAPTSSGNYSLEANIVSGGSVANLVKTITVGNSDGNSQVKVDVNSQVNTANQVLGDNKSNSLQPTPQSHADAEETLKDEGFIAGIWSKVAGFFKNLLSIRG